jgi:hypothetical protein
MANISISIPDAQVTEALNKACYALGYQSTVEQPPGVLVANPETKVQFFRRHLTEYTKALVVRGAGEEAAVVARRAAQDSAQAITVT